MGGGNGWWKCRDYLQLASSMPPRRHHFLDEEKQHVKRSDPNAPGAKEQGL